VKKTWLLVLVTLATVAACGGGTKTSATSTPSATTPPATTSAPPAPTGPPCTPSGTTLQISTGLPSPSYDRDCLAAPADTAFKIVFNNRDPGVQHNVSIYTNAGASTVLLNGRVITGPKEITYEVKALPAGIYYFRCDVHPFGGMKGAFVVSS
jgi:Cupredoxin-like domain